MRTASIAALVIAGGTLAALPFRLSPAPPDVDQAATGPSRSVLDQSGRSAATGQAATGQAVTGQAATGQNDVAAASMSQSMNQNTAQTTIQPPPVRTVARRRSYVPAPNWSADPSADQNRSVDMPLTFDDLMIPIDNPAPISQRFDATMDVTQRRHQVRHVERTKPDRVMGDQTMSPPNSPSNLSNHSVSQPPQPSRSVGSVASSRLENSSPPHLTSSEAIVMRREPMQALPQNDSQQRQKHWIVQPSSIAPR